MSVVISIGSAKTPDKTTVLKHVRDSTYSLRTHGLWSLKAKALLDWAPMVAAIPLDSENKAKILSLLQTITFSINIDSIDGVRIDHVYTRPLGADTLKTGYFIGFVKNSLWMALTLWEPFVLEPQFPKADGDYTLQSQKDGYRISSSNQATGTVDWIMLSSDLKMLRGGETGRTGAEFTPSFNYISQGAIVTGFRYHLSKEKKPDFIVAFSYKKINEFELPELVRIQLPEPDNEHSLDWTFSDFEVERR